MEDQTSEYCKFCLLQTKFSIGSFFRETSTLTIKILTANRELSLLITFNNSYSQILELLQIIIKT